MQMLMNEFGNREVRAYYVWAPILTGDTEASARQSSQRFPAANSSHFWTSSPGLIHEAAAVLQLAAGRTAWDVFLLYRKEIMWHSSFPVPSYWQQQLDIIQGAPFDPQALKMRLLDALK
jgi:hypothetical protein